MTKLNVDTWKWFKLGDLFSFEKGKCSNSDDLEEGNEIPYIGAKKTENGVMKYVRCDKKLISRKNCICFICQGAGSNGYQNYFDVDTIQTTSNMLGYNENLTPNIGMFIVAVCDLERFKWCFGRGRAPNLEKQKIKLPADKNGNPDWEYMENYIKKLRNRERECSQLARSYSELQNKSKLNLVNWKEFKINDLFIVSGSKTTNKVDIEYEKDSKYYYVTTKNQNNGVESKSNRWTEKGNCITIDSATIGAVFYQKNNFVASDHVEILRFKKEINELQYLFFVTILKLEQKRYGYGRKWNQEKIKSTKICLPIKSNGEIDFEYIEHFMKERESGIQTPLWSIFRIDEIFQIPKIKKYSSVPEEIGNIPFISSSSVNNGISSFVNEKYSFNKKCLTISTNGRCFDVFLQDYGSFCISSDVEILYNQKLTNCHYLFISTIIKLEQFKWGYGRKPKGNKIYATNILLPIDDNGNPHWKWMENYMKSLPFSKYL